MQSFHNLRVIGRIRELNVTVYRVTSEFPSDERFGLIAQMRRATVSVGANVAEGCGRSGDKALTAFLQIAMGSLMELEFEALVALDLRFLTTDEHRTLLEAITHVKRMLARLITQLRNQDSRTAMRRLGGESARTRTD